MMNPFYELTKSGQARRLRRLALNALDCYDLNVVSLDLLTNQTNTIFKLKTIAGDQRILRVTAPEGGHTADHVTAEIDWLLALTRDTSLIVPRPLPARNGDLVIKAGAAGVPDERFCVIFKWMPGSNLARYLSYQNISRLGELSARLHAHTRNYCPPANLDLLVYDRPCPFPESLDLFERAYTSLFTEPQQILFDQWLQRIQKAIDRLTSSGDRRQIIHGDLHQWNVRYYHGELSPFDFEDLLWGWPVQDISTSLYYFIDQPDFGEMRSAFETGYRRIAPWPEKAEGEINSFIGARGIGLINYVLHYGNQWGVDPCEFATRIEKRLKRLA